jgi:putative copper resistance protein D
MLTIACPAGLVLTLSGFAVSMAAMADCAIADLDRDADGHAVPFRAGVEHHRASRYADDGAWPCAGLPQDSGGVACPACRDRQALPGHAAASQGIGMVRLAGDIAHLWCGLAWLVMLFTAGLWRLRVADRPGMAQLLRHLSGFALIGGVLVGVLTLSGLANLLFLRRRGASWQPRLMGR